MSAEHDELFQLMLGRTTTKAVERILAAGFRKPQQVTTTAEIEALPVDSVLKDRVGDIYERVENPESERPVFRVPGIRGFLVPASILLPATVLHVGGSDD